MSLHRTWICLYCESYVDNLKFNKASGPDQISTNILKMLDGKVGEVLCVIQDNNDTVIYQMISQYFGVSLMS